MEADDSWSFYTRTAEQFLQSTEANSEEEISAILTESDDLRKVGDRLGALLVKWESIHEPVKLPKTWSRTPADLSGLAGEYNERISEIEEALQGDSLTLDALGEVLGTPAWRKGILQKADKAESEVTEITELLLKLFRDVPNELGQMKTGAPTPSPETSAAMVSLETAVAEITKSFLKSAKAEGLSFEGLKSLLSTAGKAALAAIHAAEQALEELKAEENRQRQKKDEEKPAKKTTKKAAAKSKSVKLQAPAAPATWFYLNEANEAQQSDLRVLADLIKDGGLTRQSHVWREGWAEWREIAQVEELAKFLGGKRPKSPPPLPGASELRAGDTALFGGIEFVWCPPGTFWMGSREDEVFETTLDETAHQVTLTRGFWIGKYPVTQRQWLRVMGGNPSEFLSSGLEAPVDSVAWEDADFFCDACRILDEVQFRLPTEAEWEYACRAGSTGTWCFGDDEEELGEYAWYGENSEDRTHPVGRKKPNAWGIHDMHGNVWEWCADWYNPYPKRAVTDPTGGEPVYRNNYGGGLIAEMYGSEPIKVYRGGFYGCKAEKSRSAARLRGSYNGFGNEGFRVAVSPT